MGKCTPNPERIRKPGFRRAPGDIGSRGFLMSQKVILSVRLRKADLSPMPKPAFTISVLLIGMVLLLDQLRNAFSHLGKVLVHQLIVSRKDHVNGGFQLHFLKALEHSDHIHYEIARSIFPISPEKVGAI